MLRKLSWMSLGLVAIAALVGACGGPRLGGEGESCTTTNDCAEGFLCVQDTCVADETSSGGGMGGGTGEIKPVLSRLGESCEVRVDCEANLSCLNGKCSVSDAPITPTGKVCESVECLTTADCCSGTVSASCQSYRDYCDGGDVQYCNYVARYCTCNTKAPAAGKAGFICTEDNTCDFVEACETSLDCSDLAGVGRYTCNTSNGTCVECQTGEDCAIGETCSSAGLCVECAVDADCGSGRSCSTAGICVSDRQCWTDQDCGDDDECSDAGKCVTAKCTSDAFCVQAWGRLDATCSGDGLCTAPCTTDAECGYVTNAGGLTLCDAGQCKYAGCESDKECQVLNGGYGTYAWRCVDPQ